MGSIIRRVIESVSEIIPVQCLIHSRASLRVAIVINNWHDTDHLMQSLHQKYKEGTVAATIFHRRNWRFSEVSQLTPGHMSGRHPSSDPDQGWQPRILVISKLYNISPKSSRSLAGQSKVQNSCTLLHNTLLGNPKLLDLINILADCLQGIAKTL